MQNQLVNIIVAYDENRCIGNKGKMPWRIPSDLRWFKKSTKNTVVIMGRKTWDSLPMQPLTNRTNIVMTRNPELEVAKNVILKGGLVADSAENAIRLAEVQRPNSEMFVIGGEQIYRTFLEAGLVDRVLASEVHGRHQGDAFFPPLEGWEKGLLETYDSFNIAEYTK